MEKLFVRLLQGERTAQIDTALRALGWAMRTQADGAVTWTVVAEADTRREGRGLFAFSSHGRHAIQAPHVPTDALTGQILLGYGRDALPRALAWNTVPRRTADMARLDDTPLVAFSRAFAQVHPQEKILQLHGFDVANRRSGAGATSSAIVSAGHRRPSPALVSAVTCMQKRIDQRARLYGNDVHELGGTQNSVARTLLASGHAGFIHVELDMPLRRSLVDDAARRRVLLECLGGRS
ncbi:MAG TPA: hypothetical protein VM406_12360 [Noviherbaspirillum sp.]|nr:hypothetical protein [Noviherbaspirillum sp.]